MLAFYLRCELLAIFIAVIEITCKMSFYQLQCLATSEVQNLHILTGSISVTNISEYKSHIFVLSFFLACFSFFLSFLLSFFLFLWNHRLYLYHLQSLTWTELADVGIMVWMPSDSEDVSMRVSVRKGHQSSGLFSFKRLHFLNEAKSPPHMPYFGRKLQK